MRQDPSGDKDKDDDNDGGKGTFGYPNVEKVLMIFPGIESKSRLKFHGVIPGKKAKLFGKIALDVVFGEEWNFRKMPGANGVITITGNRKLAEECLQKGSQIADEQMALAEFDEYKKAVDSSDPLKSKKLTMESAFQSARETKPVHIHPEDPNATPTNISTTLDSK
ncbi:uncharacterized protein [Aegilops tauschii subsp. strangulata]|uniref:uncharacterized protein n=1 Tax=Aegilops tauschii subsp. strangulata TaxID=200361 RepID=UPI003CC895A2